MADNYLRNITGPGGREFLEATENVKEAYRKGGFPSALGIGIRETPGVIASTVRDIVTPEPLRRGFWNVAEGAVETGESAITGKPVVTPTKPINLRSLPRSTPLARSTADAVRNTGPIKMTNAGITGDIQSAREQIQRNRAQQFALSDKYKQGPTGVYDVGGMDVKFAPGTDPEAARRFLRDPVHGGDRARTINAPRPLRELAAPVSELPSKEGMSRHQYQQLLTNKGELDVQRARNLGTLAEQESRNLGSLESQRLANEGALATQGLKNEQDIAEQEVLQNKARLKNEQALKAGNIQRLKDRNALFQDRLKNFAGSPEEFAQLQADANAASIEYERSLGTGTTGEEDTLARQYLQ